VIADQSRTTNADDSSLSSPTNRTVATALWAVPCSVARGHVDAPQAHGYKNVAYAYFATGQLGSARRLFVPRERTFFQAISEATVPGCLHRAQLESAGGTRRQQNGF